MTTILVAGLINIETTLKVDSFPLEYAPVRYPFFGVNSTVSGVGYNIARALTRLGDDVRFLSLIGQDVAGAMVRTRLAEDAIAVEGVLSAIDDTAQSVILYEPGGRRAIMVDLKDIQEQIYPPQQAAAALKDVQFAVICNINFARKMLVQARAAGVPIAADVHAIGDLEDAYNQDWMAAAHILFQSHENLPVPAAEWLAQIGRRYAPALAVVGRGVDGALLRIHADGSLHHIPAVQTRPVVNSIGAGDALFSAFVHSYARSGDPVAALRRAVVFASYKIGVAGAADGFLDAAGLDTWCRRVYG